MVPPSYSYRTPRFDRKPELLEIERSSSEAPSFRIGFQKWEPLSRIVVSLDTADIELVKAVEQGKVDGEAGLRSV